MVIVGDETGNVVTYTARTRSVHQRSASHDEISRYQIRLLDWKGAEW